MINTYKIVSISLLQIYPPEVFEVFKTCKDLNVYLSQLNQNEELAVAISREHVRNSHILPQPYCFKQSEIIHDYSLTFLVRKDFPHLKDLNKFIAMASASGLIQKWHSGKTIRYRNKKDSHFTSYTTTILFVLVSLGLPIIIIFLERLIYKKTHVTNPKRIWLMAEMVIDPDRHFWLETKYLNGHTAF